MQYNTKLLESYTTVSYTHLDVYKRQLLACVSGHDSRLQINKKFTIKLNYPKTWRPPAKWGPWRSAPLPHL